MCPGDGDELTRTFTIGSQWSVCPGDGDELTGTFTIGSQWSVCPGDGDERTGAFTIGSQWSVSRGWWWTNRDIYHWRSVRESPRGSNELSGRRLMKTVRIKWGWIHWNTLSNLSHHLLTNTEWSTHLLCGRGCVCDSAWKLMARTWCDAGGMSRFSCPPAPTPATPVRPTPTAGLFAFSRDIRRSIRSNWHFSCNDTNCPIS